MKLQLAIDIPEENKIFNIIESLYDFIDIVEIGTPVIMKYGTNIIRNVKTHYPKKTILADLKIIDGGKTEAEIGFSAGADIITVISSSDKNTLLYVKDASLEYKKDVMLDFINTNLISNEYKKYINYNYKYYCIHTSHDSTYSGNNPLLNLNVFNKICPNNKIVVAGGITPKILKEIKNFNPEVVVVGSYITKNKNTKSAIKKIVNILKNENN